MNTALLVAIGGLFVGFVGLFEVRYASIKRDRDSRFENFERIVDLKISEAINKLKDERLHELLRENELLVAKNDRLKEAVRDSK